MSRSHICSSSCLVAAAYPSASVRRRLSPRPSKTATHGLQRFALTLFGSFLISHSPFLSSVLCLSSCSLCCSCCGAVAAPAVTARPTSLDAMMNCLRLCSLCVVQPWWGLFACHAGVLTLMHVCPLAFALGFAAGNAMVCWSAHCCANGATRVRAMVAPENLILRMPSVCQFMRVDGIAGHAQSLPVETSGVLLGMQHGLRFLRNVDVPEVKCVLPNISNITSVVAVAKCILKSIFRGRNGISICIGRWFLRLCSVTPLQICIVASVGVGLAFFIGAGRPSQPHCNCLRLDIGGFNLFPALAQLDVTPKMYCMLVTLGPC